MHVQNMFFPMVVHVLGELEIEELCDLCIHGCGVSISGSKVCGQFPRLRFDFLFASENYVYSIIL